MSRHRRRVRGSCGWILSANVRSVAGGVTAEFQVGILRAQLPERRVPLLCEGSAAEPYHRLQRLTVHWCRGSLLIFHCRSFTFDPSLSILDLDLVELFLNNPVYSRRLLVQVTEFAERLHPGLAVFIA